MAIPTEAAPSDRSTIVDIRRELPADRAFVAHLIRAAFGGDGEAHLVARLSAEDAIAFCLVAEDPEGQIVGHIAFPTVAVTRGDRAIAATALAPVAVAPDRQRQGIGSKLIRSGIEGCRRLGVELIVVVGEPAYYTRFGFSAEVARHLSAPYSGDAFMALELATGALADDEWNVTYPRPFEEVA